MKKPSTQWIEKRDKMKKMVTNIRSMTDGQRQDVIANRSVITVEGHKLSAVNTCMVLLQCPIASVVGGFRQWTTKGRVVRKGEKAMSIWVPVHVTSADEEGDEESTIGFRLANVFDIGQTELLPEQDVDPKENE
jgi:predicted P-loop ATPase/GTPase